MVGGVVGERMMPMAYIEEGGGRGGEAMMSGGWCVGWWVVLGSFHTWFLRSTSPLTRQE